MRPVMRVGVLLVIVSAAAAARSEASPITWESHGTVTFFSDPMGRLPGIGPGSAWTFDLTFDPAASPAPWPFGGDTTACSNTASYFANPYSAHLALGGTTYTLGSQGIFEVLDPLSNQCSSTLVQFIYAGQPFPFLQVSTHFAFAATGVLPDSPTGGIELFAQLGSFPGAGQLEGFGNLQAVSTPVPEPTPFFLIAPILAIGCWIGHSCRSAARGSIWVARRAGK
jgi:hypothetical protein